MFFFTKIDLYIKMMLGDSMELVTYIQFGSRYSGFYGEDRINTSKGFNIPNVVDRVRVSCRLEDKVEYKGRNQLLVSMDISAKTIDLQKYERLIEADRYKVYQQEIGNLINEFKNIKIPQLKEQYTQAIPYMRAFDSYFSEDYGHVTKIQSERLSDINVPEDCQWFQTFNRLEKQVMLNNIPLVLYSEPVDEKSYIIADVIQGFVRGRLTGDVPFIKLRNGKIVEEMIEGEYISPRQIDKAGNVSFKPVKPILYEEVKEEYWRNNPYNPNCP